MPQGPAHRNQIPGNYKDDRKQKLPVPHPVLRIWSMKAFQTQVSAIYQGNAMHTYTRTTITMCTPPYKLCTTCVKIKLNKQIILNWDTQHTPLYELLDGYGAILD